MTDHLPLTLGEHTTALGPVTFTRIGKGGKWAFDADGCPWSVATGVHGKHFKNPRWDITGRVEPAPTVLDDPSPKRIWAWGNGKYLVYCAAVEPSNRSTVEYVRADTVAPVQLEHSRRERDKLHSQVDRVTAERDEAVALLQRWSALNIATQETRAFLAKIGGK